MYKYSFEIDFLDMKSEVNTEGDVGKAKETHLERNISGSEVKSCNRFETELKKETDMSYKCVKVKQESVLDTMPIKEETVDVYPSEDILICDICHFKSKCEQTFKDHLEKCTKMIEDFDPKLQGETNLEEEAVYRDNQESVMFEQIKIEPLDAFDARENSGHYEAITEFNLGTDSVNEEKGRSCKGSQKSVNETKTQRHSKGQTSMVHCDKCTFKARFKYMVDRHKLKHADPSQIKMFRCNLCNFQTKYSRALNKHVTSHVNPSGKLMYSCSKCGIKVSARHTLKMHMLQHEDPATVQTYHCNMCEFKTLYKYVFYRHKRNMHLSDAKTFQCNSCNFETKYKDSLQRHVESSHTNRWVTIEKKVHLCDRCGSKFTAKHSLEIHMLRHTQDLSEITIHYCNVCDFKSRYKYSVITHKNIKHCPDAVVLECALCNFKTKNKNSLRNHMRVYHTKPSVACTDEKNTV